LSSSDVLDGLAGLLEKSLVVWQAGAAGEPRYALLETVAEYAMERLEADGQVEEACHHHLAWCLALAEAVSPPPFGIFRQVHYAQLDAEIHNLRAGLAWAFQCDSQAALQLVRATSHYLTNRGFVHEARHWLNQALDLPEAAGFTLQRAELLFERGAVEHVAVDLPAVEALMTETLAISRDLGLGLGEAGAMYYLGRVAAVSGDIGRAEACLEAAAAAYHAVGDAIEGYNILSVLAEMVMFRGDLQRSRELHQQALALHLPASHRHLQIYSLGGLAELAQVEGDQAEAKRLAEQFLAASRERGNPGEIAWALTCLGEIAIRCGDLSAALVHLNEAHVVGRQGDAAWRVPIVLGTLGDLAVATGEYELALRHYQESLPALAERGIYEVPQGSLRLAVLASAVGGHILAATLLSACAGAAEAGITVFFPVTKADYDRALATTRAALDPPDFDRARAQGLTMLPQSAVAYGLKGLRVWNSPPVSCRP
jgi:tetratricopeptide (TPR) repeat protein